MNHYDSNFSAFKNRWPTLANEISKTNRLTDEIQIQKNKISVNHKQLFSVYNREKELNLFFNSTIFADKLTIYGISVGDIPDKFLTNKTMRCLQVVIMNIALFKRVLEFRDQTHWMSDPRVKVLFADDSTNFSTPMFASAPDIYNADSKCWRLKNRIIQHLNEPYLKKKYSNKKPALISRLKQTKDLRKSSLNVTELFKSAKNQYALVVAAGPSLEKTIRIIKNLKSSVKTEDYRVIAVDVSCPILFRNGITPDLIVTLDTKITLDYVLRENKKENLSQSALVHSMLVHPDLISDWKFNRYCFQTKNESELVDGQTNNVGELFSGGSVIHPAIDLARRMDFRKTFLFGADFGFIDGKTHALWKNKELMKYENNDECYVLSGSGRKINSTSSFSSYLTYLEAYLRAHPEFLCFNTSNEGAAIQGAPVLSNIDENLHPL